VYELNAIESNVITSEAFTFFTIIRLHAEKYKYNFGTRRKGYSVTALLVENNKE
jgi:hypothetical protein